MDDFKTAWLCALLDCDEADLCVLERCEYDFSRLVEKCGNTYGDVNINELIRTIIDTGLDEMWAALTRRGTRLESKQKVNKETMSAKQQEELADLKNLYPLNDIWAECDGARTQVWFQSNIEEYQRYAEPEVALFEKHTGFQIMT